jgi:hypothetical protein
MKRIIIFMITCVLSLICGVQALFIQGYSVNNIKFWYYSVPWLIIIIGVIQFIGIIFMMKSK